MSLSAGATHNIKKIDKLEYEVDSSGSKILYPGALIDLKFSDLTVDNLDTSSNASAGRLVLGNINEAINLNKDEYWNKGRVQEGLVTPVILTDVSIAGIASHAVAITKFLRPVYATDENTFTITQSGDARFIGLIWVDSKDYGILIPSVEAKIAIAAGGGLGNRRLMLFDVDLTAISAGDIWEIPVSTNVVVKKYGFRTTLGITDATADFTLDLTVDGAEQLQTLNHTGVKAVNLEVEKTLTEVAVSAFHKVGIKYKTETVACTTGRAWFYLVVDMLP